MNSNITLVDSHCHLDMLETPLDEILTNAAANNVKHFLCVSVVLEKFAAMLELTKNHDNIHVSIGLHPDEVLEDSINEPTLDDLLQLGQHPKCIAIGETGLDYYRQAATDATQRSIQQERFRRHIQAAHILKKPLIIHTRAAQTDTIALMQEERANEPQGVMHCFTESWEVAKAALDLDFYISFSGIITFKNAQDLRDVVKKMPMDKLLIETDAPFLAPIPHRGKTNQPAYVYHVAEEVARIKGISFEEVAEITTQNYFNLFKLTP